MILWLGACNPPLPELHDAHRDLTGALPVFPGAEGFGTDTPGGRGGEVRVVDTLAADGPGSLKAAVQGEGPRTVVFEVGGVIRLTENLRIDDGYLTVAGQTAPDPGITVYGAGLEIAASHVVVQHLHIRPGDAPDGPKPTVRDAIAIVADRDDGEDVHHVVIDHCSLSWGVDETFSTWFRGVRDVTLSNSLVSESLDDSLHPEGHHGKGLLIGDHTRRVSVLRTLLAYNPDRNPIVKGDASALVANVWVVDPDRWPVTLFDQEDAGPSLLTLRGSQFERGVDTPVEHATVWVDSSMKPGTAMFLDDLASWDIDGDPWAGVELDSARDEVRVDGAPVTVEPLTLLPVDQVREHLLEQAGARPSARDPVDTRVIDQLRRGVGQVIDSPADVGGLGAQPETRRALDVPPDPTADSDGDGWTDVEEWIHGFGS
ncbi:MAG: hypothetical protein ABMA64_14735 [Myxococcota bacterium]